MVQESNKRKVYQQQKRTICSYHINIRRKQMASNVSVKLDGLDDVIMNEIMRRKSSTFRGRKENVLLEGLRTFYDINEARNWR